MFIAMNRFKVIKDEAEGFEALWLGRDSFLKDSPGYIEFQMLRGPEREDHVLYSSHTLWASKAHFEEWTRSEQFRAAHRNAGDYQRRRLGHAEFEGFEVIQTLHNPALKAAE